QGFEALARHDLFMRYPMQPWPIFLSSARQRQLAETARSLYDLVRSIPQRAFDNIPERLAARYCIERGRAGRGWGGGREGVARPVSAAIEATGGARGLLARGDFIDSPDGFKCIEFNVAGNLGGWGSAVWAERYRQVPLIQRFLAETGTRVGCTDTALALFRN